MLSESKILIVDDDVLNILFIRSSLETSYQLFEAHNGVEAVQVIPDLLPDLILLDWNMPHLDGMGVLTFLNNNPKFRAIQVIMMTGMMTTIENLTEAFNKGVVDFIKKPFEFPELQARVKSALQIAYYHKQELQKKDQELVALTMKKIENIEFIKTLFERLASTRDAECQSNLKEFQKEFNTLISENTWKSFDDNFTAVYPDFYKNLVKDHPDLSPAELKLCRLLRLNLSTKEISAITYTTPESIKVGRSRLRKKLNLEYDDNLTGYLMRF